jgi:hypothetical protein
VTFTYRLHKRITSLAVMSLVAWLLAFASHIHSPKDIADESPSKAHACLFCAALQPGGGAVANETFIAPQQPVWDEISIILPARFVRAFALYLSRAPPLA